MIDSGDEDHIHVKRHRVSHVEVFEVTSDELDRIEAVLNHRSEKEAKRQGRGKRKMVSNV